MKRIAPLILLLACPALWGAPPALKIDPEVKPAGQYARFTPGGDCVAVLYVGLSGVDPLPSDVLKDGRMFLLDTRGLAAGRYRFAAVGSSDKGEQARADFVVVVGDAPPGPGPGPGPTPPPMPDDAFGKALVSAWQATPQDERAKLALLAGLYKASAKDVKASDKAKVFDFYQAMAAARKTLVGDSLGTIRAAITKELDATLPTSTDAPLDDAAKDRCAAAFARVADYLGRLQ